MEKNVREKLLNLSFIVLIIFLSLWVNKVLFKDGLPLLGQDTVSPVTPLFRLKGWFHSWEGNLMLGASYPTRIILLFPEMVAFAVLSKLGFSLLLIQKIVYSQIFLVSGLGMYFLALSLFKRNYLLAFIAAIVYMFNHVQLGYWRTFLVESSYILAFFPLLLAIFIKGLKSKNYFLWASLFAFSSLFCSAANPPLYVLIFMVMAVFLVYYFLTLPEKRRIVKFVVASGAFYLLFNLWWILPSARSFVAEMQFYKLVSDAEGRLGSSCERSSFLNNFILQGNNYSGYSYWEDKVSDFISFLYQTNPWLVLSSFIYPILAFSALFFKRNRNKVVILLLSLSIVSIFLTKGVCEPLGFIYQQIYRYVPGFSMFRTPSDKFPMVTALGYSLLIGTTVFSLYQIFLRYSKLAARLFFAVIVVVLLLIQWPFFTGDFIHNGKDAFPPAATKIPDYYWEAADWLKSQKEPFRIFNFPGSDYPSRWVVYRWGYLGVYRILSDILQKPVIDKMPFDDLGDIRLGTYALLGNFRGLPAGVLGGSYLNYPETKEAPLLLGLMNVRYLLFNRDVDSSHLHFGTEDLTILQKNIESQENTKLVRSFNNLDFYEVDPKVFYPRVYVPEKKVYVYGNTSDLPNLTDFLPSGKIEILFRNSSNFQPPDFSQGDVLVFSPIKYVPETTTDSVFPFARISPANPLYRFILWKESRQMRKNQDFYPRTLLRFMFANKRLMELNLLVNKKRYTLIKQTLEGYFSEMNRAILEIEAEKKKESDISYMVARAKKNVEDQQKFLAGFLASLLDKLPENEYQDIENAVSKFRDISQGVNALDYFWWKGPFAYEFTIPQKGDYELFLYGNGLKKDFPQKEPLSGKVVRYNETEGINVVEQKNQERDSWVSFGKISLAEGRYVFYLNLSEGKNIIKSEAEIRLEATEKKRSLTVPFVDFEPRGLYQLSFEYKHDQDSTPKFIFWQYIGQESSDEKINQEVTKEINFLSVPTTKNEKGINMTRKTNVIIDIAKSFSNSPTWSSYKRMIKIHPEAKRVGVTFFADKPLMEERTVNFYRNVDVRRVLSSPVVLQKKSDKITSETPQIEFKQINPSKYSVKITGNKAPFTLALLENFSYGWKAFAMSQGKKELISPAKHILVNGYANGWLLDANADYNEISLEYTPQRWVYLGVLISSISVLLVGLICFILIKR